jgi:hypothetical protein
MENKSLQLMVDTIQAQIASLDDVPDIIKIMLNLIEFLVENKKQSDKIIQQLKNKINELKGETTSPNIRKQSKDNNKDLSSNSDRKKRIKQKKGKPGGSKKSSVKIDKTKKLTIEKKDLPIDAKRAGIKITVIQDVIFTTENIAFERQMYFSASENKYYIAPLPAGYEGEYAPSLKAWIKTLYGAVQMTKGNIVWLLNTVGTIISKATVSRIITNNNEILHAEKDDIVKAGLQSTTYQNLDDTSGRERGQNCYVNVLTNEYYAAFFTLPRKDRLSLIETLSVDGLKFLFNEISLTLMIAMKLPQKHIDFLKLHVSDKYWLRSNVDILLTELFPNAKKHKGYRKIILEAAAIAAYRQSDYAIRHLIVDDAPQFKLITETLGLCWVHEGRHYKKLNPIFTRNKKILNDFVNVFWDYYQQLKDYKKNPSKQQAKILEKKFDDLFSKETGYETLDNQIYKTFSKKESLLLVLTYPFIPIHNNPAELIARFQARTRDVHLHTMCIAGTKIKDTLATISMTARKLGVNIFDYLFDRIAKMYNMTSLAETIKIRAKLTQGETSLELLPN